MNFIILFYFLGVVLPWLEILFKMYFPNENSYSFSKETMKKIKVKENSFLRKIIPFTEGEIIKKEEILGYKYLIYPYAFYLIFQTILSIILLILIIIDMIWLKFLSNLILLIIAGFSFTVMGVFAVYINNLSHRH